MTKNFNFYIKSKIRKEEVEELVEKIGKKFIINSFDKSESIFGKKFPAYHLYLTGSKKQDISSVIHFCFFNVQQDEQPIEKAILWVLLDIRDYKKFTNFLEFICWVINLLKVKEAFGGTDDTGTDYPSIVMLEENSDRLEHFREYLIKHNKFNKIQNSETLFNEIKKYAVKIEIIENFKIYYLLPKKGENSIWTGKIPDFYKQLVHQKNKQKGGLN